MALIAALLAILASGLFAGASLYITLVEHPARLSCGLALALSEFRPSYKRAAVLQASLALIGAIAGVWRWSVAGGSGWLAGGVLLGSVIPFTLVVVRPTNNRLLDPALDPGSRAAASLLARWGRLHAVRSVLSVAAFVTFVVLLARR